MSIWTLFIVFSASDPSLPLTGNLMDSFLCILLAIGLDLVVGDPRWLPHPVRAIGRLCEGSEKMTRALFANLYLAGLMTVFVVLSTTGFIVFLLLQVASSLSPMFGATCRRYPAVYDHRHQRSAASQQGGISAAATTCLAGPGPAGNRPDCRAGHQGV